MHLSDIPIPLRQLKRHTSIFRCILLETTTQSRNFPITANAEQIYYTIVANSYQAGFDNRQLLLIKYFLALWSVIQKLELYGTTENGFLCSSLLSKTRNTVMKRLLAFRHHFSG